MPRWRNVHLRTGSSQRAALRMIYFFHLCTHTVTFSDINLSVNLLGGLIYILTKTGLSHQRRNRENEASLKRINLCHRPHPPQSCVTLTHSYLLSVFSWIFLPPCTQQTDDIMASPSLTVKLFVPVVIKAKGMKNKAKEKKHQKRAASQQPW